MIRTTLFLLIGTLALHSHAQLYMPRDIREAYDRGERSRDGRPAMNYWQNSARYNISVEVDPKKRSLTGYEEIVYKNNSPVDLDYLNYRLFQNIHKPGGIRNYDAEPGYLTDGIHIDSMAVNGKPVVWVEPTANLTYKWISLPAPLKSKDSVKIYFKWHYTIAEKARREGMLDSSGCFIAYFYPRVAVVDDYNWWDWMDFTDQQEFYNDFNDYTLNVTVPENYIVWATGDLQNMDVLQPEYRARLQRSFTSDEVISIATKEEMLKHKVTKQGNANTWKWTSSWVPDVAFGVTDHFKWEASSVEINKGRRVSVQAVYDDAIPNFKTAVQTGRHAIRWFSDKWPGVPYPYSKMTISSGFDDMEYPMMANDLPDTNLKAASLITMHEIAHTWFPFYMGINESRYAFMDEGWATAFEYLINSEDAGKAHADSAFRTDRVKDWITDPSSTEDLPIITPTDVLKGMAYGSNAYGKPALAYLALKDLLGDAIFKKGLHEFMDRWHGKHPIPWDFFYTFNDVAGNLDWYWNPWFFSNGYCDIGIDTVQKNATGYSVKVKNTGGFLIPFDVKVTYSDGSVQALHYSPVVWKKNNRLAVIPLNTKKSIRSVLLDTTIYMDDKEKDNTWKSKAR